MPELENLLEGEQHSLFNAPQIAGDPSADSDRDELMRLRHLVHEKDQALFRAVMSEIDLQKQLQEVMALSEVLKLDLAVARQHSNPGHPGNSERQEWLRV